jgi:cell wall-associated NlpC family hydrolase
MIPRRAIAQRRVARPVGTSRVKPGDLVFFRIGNGHHVGLMVDETRFVHASTSAKQVRLANLQAPYWRQRFVGAGSYFE